eukprot:gene23771-biopygen4359
MPAPRPRHARATPAPPQAKHGLSPAPRPRHARATVLFPQEIDKTLSRREAKNGHPPFFNGFGGFSAGSSERRPQVVAGPFAIWCARGRTYFFGAPPGVKCSRMPPGAGAFGASVGRPRAGGWRRGGLFFLYGFRRGTRIWHAYCEFAPRCEPHPERAKWGPMIRMGSRPVGGNEKKDRDAPG